MRFPIRGNFARTKHHYAPAWKRLFSHFNQVEELEEVVGWTKCIISIRCISLDTETPEAIAALHHMLDCCEAFYPSATGLYHYLRGDPVIRLRSIPALQPT